MHLRCWKHQRQRSPDAKAYTSQPFYALQALHEHKLLCNRNPNFADRPCQPAAILLVEERNTRDRSSARASCDDFPRPQFAILRRAIRTRSGLQAPKRLILGPLGTRAMYFMEQSSLESMESTPRGPTPTFKCHICGHPTCANHTGKTPCVVVNKTGSQNWCQVLLEK